MQENSMSIKKLISDRLVAKYSGKHLMLHDLTPSQDFEWIKYNCLLPWLELPLEVPCSEILSEIKQVEHLLVNHRDEQGEHSGWRSFCIHGKSYDSTKEDSHYDNDIEHHFTQEACALMPRTVKYFQTVYPASRYARVRVMALDPGGFITVHNDYKSSRLSPVNIAITQPENCCFVMDKHGEVPFEVGKSFWLDVSNLHTVVNNSSETRYHLIVHSEPNQKFKELVVEQYNLLYNSTL